MTTRTLSRLALILAILLPALLAQPAQACGCGGYVGDGDGYVTQEQVLLRWDGQTEQVLMSLGVLGSSTAAAVILPVPNQATVDLGDSKVWDELQILTLPLIVHEKHYLSPFDLFAAGAEGAPAPGGGVGSAPPVTVLSRQTLGPFEVTNLAATDADALVGWLTDNGYTLSDGLASAFEPYIAQGWFYVAVKLSPGAGDVLTGELDPLHVTFASDKLVYPMRGSANASEPESVILYVLADHRVDKTQDFGNSHIPFADWVDPATLSASPSLTPFVNQKLFLTKFEEQVIPSQVNDDFWFTFTAQDTVAHDTITVYDDDYTFVYLSLAGLCLLILLPILALAGFILYAVRRRSPKNV